MSTTIHKALPGPYTKAVLETQVVKQRREMDTRTARGWTDTGTETDGHFSPLRGKKAKKKKKKTQKCHWATNPRYKERTKQKKEKKWSTGDDKRPTTLVTKATT